MAESTPGRGIRLLTHENDKKGSLRQAEWNIGFSMVVEPGLSADWLHIFNSPDSMCAVFLGSAFHHRIHDKQNEAIN